MQKENVSKLTLHTCTIFSLKNLMHAFSQIYVFFLCVGSMVQEYDYSQNMVYANWIMVLIFRGLMYRVSGFRLSSTYFNEHSAVQVFPWLVDSAV